jgi:superfamily I DNA/RNA helicase
MDNATLYLGPPGTGKTTTLINAVEAGLKEGLTPERIGFMSFTKKAVEEAASRTMDKFDLSRRQLQFYKTTHSMAFFQLGLSTHEVMQRNHYRDLGKQLGVPITGIQRQDLATFEMNLGDQIIFIESLSRLKMQDIRTTWEDQQSDVTWLELNFVVDGLRQYKKANLLVDYTDMLVQFYDQGMPPSLDLLIIDEAQDLCLLQWKILERLISVTPKVIIAGDDDQAIFRWSGAAVEHFTALTKQVAATRVLNQSYRLPKSIKAQADQIITKVKGRHKKVFKPTKETGKVEVVRSIEDIDMATGQWLILMRNNFQIKEVIDYLKLCGFVYKSVYGDVRDNPGVKASLAWESLRAGRPVTKDEVYFINKFMSRKMINNVENIDKRRLEKPWYDALDLLPLDESEYYRACRRRNESFITAPRIHVNTIHGSKGSESENVVLSLDMSLRSYEGYIKNPDDEARVYYVGATRAKKNLFILQPKTANHYVL